MPDPAPTIAFRCLENLIETSDLTAIILGDEPEGLVTKEQAQTVVERLSGIERYIPELDYFAFDQLMLFAQQRAEDLARDRLSSDKRKLALCCYVSCIVMSQRSQGFYAADEWSSLLALAIWAAHKLGSEVVDAISTFVDWMSNSETAVEADHVYAIARVALAESACCHRSAELRSLDSTAEADAKGVEPVWGHERPWQKLTSTLRKELVESEGCLRRWYSAEGHE